MKTLTLTQPAPYPLPARCGLCGSRRCDQPGSEACNDARMKRVGDE